LSEKKMRRKYIEGTDMHISSFRRRISLS
jgi:hypothetical protein